jgi:tRNA pseudouridine55 synthase
MMSKKDLKDIHGFVIFDKPKGWSSQKAVTRIRYLFQAKKAGHAGTLDPMATGVLIIALGRATKLLPHLVLQDKKYEACIQLGIATDTYDAEGEILDKKEVKDIDHKDIEAALDHFRGGYSQVPPIYSALKLDGKPLYKHAREGLKVDIKSKIRDIKIHNLDCLKYDKNLKQLSISVHCSKGTYIRSLACDICEKLDTLGHLISLRRIASGDFNDADILKWSQCEDDSENNKDNKENKISKYLLSIDKVFASFPKVGISSEQYRCLIHGIKITDVLLADCDSWVRLYADDKFVAIGELKEGLLVSRKLG